MATPKFYFALTGSREAWDASMLHEDRKILNFNLTHKEAECATLDITIQNPQVPPLSEPIWCWFTFFDGSNNIPLFCGRLIAVPTGLATPKATYKYMARPEDFVAQKEALADALRVMPHWDPLTLDTQAQDDPDPVLEAYTLTWHVGRTDLVVTTTDLLFGEDGTITFSGNNVLHDSVDCTIERNPITSIDVTGTVSWGQQGKGFMGIGKNVMFGKVQDPNQNQQTGNTGGIGGVGNPSSGSGTGDGEGWQFTQFVLNNDFPDTIPITSWQSNYQNNQKTHNDGDTMSVSESFSGPHGYGPLSGTTLTEKGSTVVGDPLTGTPASSSYQRTGIVMVRYGATVGLGARYSANRKRTETVKFTLVSDLQPILHNPDDDSQMATKLDITSQDVGLTDGNHILTPPIGDLGRNSFFPTARGNLLLENLILRARAHLIAGARIVKVVWDTPFTAALNLSCRMNASIADPDVPGGLAAGKVTSYSLTGDGATGVFKGHVEITCTPGLEAVIEDSTQYGTITTQEGFPDYIVNDYIDTNYYARTSVSIAVPVVTGEIVVTSGASDVGYTPPIEVPSSDDLNFPLSARQVVVSSTITSSLITDLLPPGVPGSTNSGEPPAPSQQFQDIQQKNAAAIQDAMQKVAGASQTWSVELKDISGQVAAREYDITVTVLQIPLQINFE